MISLIGSATYDIQVILLLIVIWYLLSSYVFHSIVVLNLYRWKFRYGHIVKSSQTIFEDIMGYTLEPQIFSEPSSSLSNRKMYSSQWGVALLRAILNSNHLSCHGIEILCLTET